ncbi:MAG: hypothetical protein P1U74_00835 [Legionellaceae bacterium]|nr:hypothetical protein [Legionellaceae bacterium]
MEFQVYDTDTENSDDDLSVSELDIDVHIKQNNHKNDNYQRLRNRYAIEEILERRKLLSEVEDEFLL